MHRAKTGCVPSADISLRELLADYWPGEWGAEPIAEGNAVRVFRSTDIDDDGHLNEAAGGVLRQIPIAQVQKKALRPGDIVVEASGGTPDRPVGRVAIFRGESDETCLCANFLRTIRPGSKIDPKYLLWRLLALHRSSTILRYQQQTTGIINLQFQDYLNTRLSLVPVEQQRRIAEILGTVDRAIQETEALIAKHEMIKAGMMHDLFTRGVLPNGELRPPPTEAPDLYKDSPLGLIPKEWEVVPLSCMATVDRGKFTIRPRNDPRYYGGEFPFIQTGEVANAGGAVLVTFTQSLNQRGLEVSRIFPAGTVMVTIAANIGDTCIIGIPMCAPDSLVAVVPNDHADSRFLEMSVRRQKSRLEARAPQTAQRNINLEDLRPLKITKPHREERQHICQKCASISSVIDTEKHEVRKLASLKKGLMSVLLSPPA